MSENYERMFRAKQTDWIEACQRIDELERELAEVKANDQRWPYWRERAQTMLSDWQDLQARLQVACEALELYAAQERNPDNAAAKALAKVRQP